MSWMSKHATEHKHNLLQDMPIDDQGSTLEMEGSPLQRTTGKVDYSERTNRQARRLGKLDTKRAEGKRKGSDKRREKLAGKLNKAVEGTDIHDRREANRAYDEGSSPLTFGCAKSEGGSGCVKKRGDEWVILNNKKPGNKVWRSGFSSKAQANDQLAGYHANK